MAGFDLFCLGGASVDLVLRIPRMPDGDEKLLADYVGQFPGGLVSNNACAAARLGLHTGWSGYLGDDDGARLLMDDFTRFGVDASAARQLAGQSSDLCVILLQPTGDRCILVANTLPGPLLLEGDLVRSLEQARVVYTLPYQLDWFAQLSRIVHSAGHKLAVDLESSAPLQGGELKAAIQQADLVFCSQGGLELITGTKDPEVGGKSLLEQGAELVVITQGKKGAWALDRSSACFSPAFQVPVADTTGAGDCFHAAFLTVYLEGWSLHRCLRFAHAAAALKVQQMGARGGLPTRDQVEMYLKDIPDAG